MAQPMLKHSQTVVIDELRQNYELDDEDDVLAFLELRPAVVPLLFDIRSNIRRFFGEDSVRLEMFHDPEWPEDGPKLVVNIQTPLGPLAALDRLHEFDDEWWIKKHSESRAPLLVSIELVPRV